MKKIFILASFLFLVGCDSAPIKGVDSGNPGVTSDLMAVVEGCKIFRVHMINERTIYFAKCGSQSNVSWDRSCGKGCTSHELVLTENER